MSEPTIRAATLDDVDELCRLRWQLYTEHRPEIAEPFEAYRERFVAFASWAIAREDWSGWVAVTGDAIVGNAWLQTVPRIPAPGRRDPSPIGYLTNMYIAPDRRSGGLGRRLLNAVLDHCRTAGFESVLTFPADAAAGFYERAGFTRPPYPVVHELGSVGA